MAASLTLNSPAGPNPLTRGGQPSGSTLASSPLASLGYQLTLVYIVMLVGRTPEITAFLIGNSLYQVLVVTAVLSSLAIMTGVLMRVGATRCGLFWIAFHLWVMVTLPLSGYRRGSFEAFGGMMKYLPALFFVGGFLIRNTDTLRRGLWSMAWAGTLGLAWAVYTGGVGEDEERFASVGTFSNANELAIYILLMIPAWGFIVANSRYRWFTRLLFTGVTVVGLLTILKTGSRSGLMSIGLLALAVFFSLSISNKMKFLVVTGAVVAAVAIWSPESLKTRWATILSDKAKVSDEVAAAAVGSSDARYALLIESLQTTWNHPILGTGIGVYADVNASEKQVAGQRALWQVTHNAYTQVSAETGIPGFILYMTALYLAIKEVWRVRRMAKTNPRLAELGMIATALLYSYLVFCFNGFFTSMATQFTIYALAGFSIATRLVSQQYLEAPAPQAARIPAGPRPFFPNARPKLAPATKPDLEPATPAKTGKTTPVKNEDAPWRRNPRRHPPSLGTPSR